MRPGALALALALSGGFATAAPWLATARRAEDVEQTPISTALLNDIYTYAAFTRAAYCAVNHDGKIGNLLCNNTASAHACDVFGGAATSVEFTHSAAVAGNIVVLHERRLAVVSFHGSSRWSDVVRNLRMQREDVPALCANCSVHNGYWTAFLDIRDRLDAALLGSAALASADYRLVLAGHSLGGAIATVAAAHLRSRGRHCDLFTYGAPRAGSKELAELIGGYRNGVTAHVVNRNDVVASKPPDWFGYAGNVPEYWFSGGIEEPASPDNLRVCDGFVTDSDACSAGEAGWFPTITDHTIDAYSNRSMPCPNG